MLHNYISGTWEIQHSQIQVLDFFAQLRARVHRGGGGRVPVPLPPQVGRSRLCLACLPEVTVPPLPLLWHVAAAPGSLWTKLGIGPSTALTGCPGLAPSRQAWGVW